MPNNMEQISAIDVKNLSVKFDDFIAVNNISFSVKKGEIFGFLGANGAGKTTTIKVICGLQDKTSGVVNTTDKHKIGYMSQKFTLYNDLTVIENLDFVAALRKLPKAIYNERKNNLLKFIDFNFDIKHMVRNLPLGIKQQIALLASLLHEPEVIILDEPTAGVSPKMRFRFWQLIRQLSSQGKTIMVTTHYMDEAMNCERISFMKDGNIIDIDTPINLINKFKSNTLEEAFIKADNEFTKS